MNFIQNGLILVLVLCLSLACGGGGSSNFDSSSSIVDWGDLKPTPMVGQKKVYSQTIYGKTHQVSEEIVSINTSEMSVTTITMREGVYNNRVTRAYKLIDGKVYLTGTATDSGIQSYKDPGFRVQLEDAEFSKTEFLEAARLQGGLVYTFNLKKSQTLEAIESLNVLGANRSAQKIKVSHEYSTDSLGVFQKNENTQWMNQEYGLVKDEELFNRQIISLKLIQLEENSDDLYTIENNQIKSNFSKMILDVGQALANSNFALPKEVYRLAVQWDECVVDAPYPVELAQVVNLYRHYYLYPENLPSVLPTDFKVSTYINALNEKDKFTFYFSPEAYSNFKQQVSGDKSVMGIVLGNSSGGAFDLDEIVSSDNPVTIKEVLPLSRAWTNGLMAQDTIEEIDGKNINGMSYSEAKALLPTEEEQEVTLRVKRNGVFQDIKTAAENCISRILTNDIAYINLRKFTTLSEERIRNDFDQLVSINGSTPKGLILDLRYNGGGSASGARKLLDYLIDLDSSEDKNMYQVDDSLENYFFGDHSDFNISPYDESNFVVLVNEDSASASEITAGVLGHYEKAKVIGAKTFGKGVSQSLYELNDESGVAITFQKIVLAGDQDYHDQGISPDIIYTTSPIDINNDEQLDFAINYITTGNIQVTKPILQKATEYRYKIDPLQIELNKNYH